MKYEIQPYSIHELGQRENQEDSLFPSHGKAIPSDRLFILCDGMGGHENGEVASATVCEVMSQTILSRWQSDEPLSDDLLLQALDAAYDALDAKDGNAQRKMGTTLTLLCLHANGATVAHIGDSRVYQFRPGAGVVFRTQDHSLVNDLIKIGEITEEEAKTHPQKNVITRAMQPHQPHRAKADIAHLTDIQSGDYFFLCSDGMLEQTTNENLANIITKGKVSNEQKIEMLRSVTDENKDNHTAHLIYINKVEGGNRAPQGVQVPQGVRISVDAPRKRRRLWPYIIGVVVFAFLAFAVAAVWHTFGSKDETKEKANTVVIIKEVHHTDTVKETIPQTKKDSVIKNRPQMQEAKPSLKPEKKPITMPKPSRQAAKEKEAESTETKKNDNKPKDDHATTEQGDASAWKHV